MSTLGVIGGSGLYQLDGLTNVEEIALDTPFGAPSDRYIVGRLGDVRMVFLPRHGRGHRVLPHEINFRANLHGMKQLGVERVVAVSAVGSMQPEIRPGDLVVVDQFIDHTRRRVATFFGDGVAGHVPFGDPVCADLRASVLAAARGAVTGDTRAHDGGTYLVIDGPQFSTRAESLLYRSWGVSVIGMTCMPEAKLAREAELCYSTLALSTDYDCWHESEEDVTAAAVMAMMQKNVVTAREVLRRVALAPAQPRTCPCTTAAAHAIMTDAATIPAETRARLDLLVGKYLRTPA